MKKLIIALLFLMAVAQVRAQETNRVHEVGLVFSSVDQFGIRYKVGHDNIRYRLTASSLNFKHTDYDDQNSMYKSATQWGVTLSGGIEKYHPLTDDFGLYCGSDLSLGYSSLKTALVSSNDDFKQNYYTIGLSGIFGARYQFSKAWSLSAELTPTLYYNRIKAGSDMNGDVWSFNFASNQATLCLSYQF